MLFIYYRFLCNFGAGVNMAGAAALKLHNKHVATMTRLDFIEFLKEFRTDLKDYKSKWENTTLDDFLEAMERYTIDVLGYYDNMKPP